MVFFNNFKFLLFLDIFILTWSKRASRSCFLMRILRTIRRLHKLVFSCFLLTWILCHFSFLLKFLINTLSLISIIFYLISHLKLDSLDRLKNPIKLILFFEVLRNNKLNFFIFFNL